MFSAALSAGEIRVIRYALALGMLLGMVLSSCAPRPDLAAGRGLALQADTGSGVVDGAPVPNIADPRIALPVTPR